MVPREEVSRRIARGWRSSFPVIMVCARAARLRRWARFPKPWTRSGLRAEFWSYQIGAWYDAKDDTLALADHRKTSEGKENALGLAFAQTFREHGADLFRPEEGRRIPMFGWRGWD